VASTLIAADAYNCREKNLLTHGFPQMVYASDFFDDILAKHMERRQWDQLYTEGDELLGLAWKSSQQHSMVRSA